MCIRDSLFTSALIHLRPKRLAMHTQAFPFPISLQSCFRSQPVYHGIQVFSYVHFPSHLLLTVNCLFPTVWTFPCLVYYALTDLLSLPTSFLISSTPLLIKPVESSEISHLNIHGKRWYFNNSNSLSMGFFWVIFGIVTIAKEIRAFFIVGFFLLCLSVPP